VHKDHQQHASSRSVKGPRVHHRPRQHGKADITVLAPSVRLSPDIPPPATGYGIVYAQDVYFLGYPYNVFADLGEINRNFPMPFVKKAILSSMYETTDGLQVLFLEGHSSPGCSGEPAVSI
jgi:hypothetical protein